MAVKICYAGRMSLLDWCKEHGEQGARLIAEWTGICSDGNTYEMYQVAAGSTKKFKWVCIHCGHEWWAKVQSRTHGSNCKSCVKKIVGQLVINRALAKGNSLLEWCKEHGEQGARIIAEWTGICIDGQTYEMNQVSFGSKKRFKWVCSDGHEWYAAVNYRTQGHNCSYCAGIIVTDKNSLETWCREHGEQGARLKAEWTGICEGEDRIYGMDEVTPGSGKKFKWRCIHCGREWYAPIYSRVNGRNCTSCSRQSTSYPEQFIYWCLKQIYPKAENRCRVLRDAYTGGLEFDMGIPSIPLCIEYSPTFWHSGKEERDQLKREVCKKCNVRLIEIIDDNFDEYEETFTDDLIITKVEGSNKDEALEKIVTYILSLLDHSIKEINIEKAKANAYKYSHGAIEYEKSLAFKQPKLAEEFHPTLNGDKKASDITPGSNVKIYWQCTKCGYGKDGAWMSPPGRRSAKGYETGCPCCGYNWHDGEIHQNAIRKSKR